MSREIKFRAWDINNRVMLHSSEGEPPNDASVGFLLVIQNGVLYWDIPDMGYYGGGEWTRKQGQFEIMQYTGLKDKDGTQIYEGDILSIQEAGELQEVSRGDVEWVDTFWYVNGEHDALCDLNQAYYLEIIGNIHDNPELLQSL